jgi:hypothetical protein
MRLSFKTLYAVLAIVALSIAPISPSLHGLHTQEASAGVLKRLLKGAVVEEAAGLALSHEEKVVGERIAQMLATPASRARALEELEAFAARHPRIAGKLEQYVFRAESEAKYKDLGFYKPRQVEDLVRANHPETKSTTLPRLSDPGGRGVVRPTPEGDVPYLSGRGTADFSKYSKASVNIEY